MASEVLRNVDIVIRGCPFPVDVSISNVAEEASAGLFVTNESGVSEDRPEVAETMESDTRSQGFEPSIDEMTS